VTRMTYGLLRRLRLPERVSRRVGSQVAGRRVDAHYRNDLGLGVGVFVARCPARSRQGTAI
jgi:hypothetical protein